LIHITLGKRLKQLPTVLSEEFLDEVTTFQWFNEIHNLYFLSDKSRMKAVQEGIRGMYDKFLPYITEIVRESEERETAEEYNYMKKLADGTRSIEEIVMSTLDLILAGTRSVSC